MISRNFTWIDENIEHSDEEYARATALAKKWSALQTEEENRMFRRRYDYENGYDWDPFEDCECEYCLSQNHTCDDLENGECSICKAVSKTELTECSERAAWRQAQEVKQAERDLEIELVEDKLAKLGARMMRPYEHWNEDERYMEYMETKEE